MKEIKIDGLTPEQCDMLDIMWSLDGIDEVTEWLETLSDDDLRMALTLKEMLLAHCFDEFDDTKFANEYLQKFRL